MKYIEKYKNLYGTPGWLPYWKVKCEMPYFEIALDKIGIDPKFKVLFMNKYYNDQDDKSSNISNHKEVYIGETGGRWTWSEEQSDYENSTSKKYIYMDEVEITPEDIKEWEIKHSAGIYNI